MTIEEPASATPSIIEVAPPVVAAAAAEHVAVTSEGSLELAALDPLKMMQAGANSVVRIEALTPSVIAVIVPSPEISNEIVAAIDGRKAGQDPLPMVMRGGIVGDPFTAEIELGKALKKLPANAQGNQPLQTQLPVDPEAINKPQYTETGERMPANGMGGGRPRHSALTRSAKPSK